jgi:hypothetical protein
MHSHNCTPPTSSYPYSRALWNHLEAKLSQIIQKQAENYKQAICLSQSVSFTASRVHWSKVPQHKTVCSVFVCGSKEHNVKSWVWGTVSSSEFVRPASAVSIQSKVTEDMTTRISETERSDRTWVWLQQRRTVRCVVLSSLPEELVWDLDIGWEL